jgi:hypothetical protein
VEAHGSAVGQRDPRRRAGVAAEAERELARPFSRDDAQRGADVLVGVEEAFDLPQDPPAVELPQQGSAREAFALGFVAAPLADREQQPALGVVPRLVG